MSLEQGSWGRIGLMALQTAGTIVATAYGGAWAGIAASAAHTAFWMWYDTTNVDGTVNKQESIQDLRIQTSTLGQAIPQVFGGFDGTVEGSELNFGGRGGGRLSGNIFFATEKRRREHRETTGGKGGEPEVTTITFTYSSTMAVGICDTRVSGPIDRLQRAWKNTNLLFETPATLFPTNWVLHTGTADQLPDINLEGIQGAGETTGYPCLCYIVMVEEDLGASGQLPQWSFEPAQAEAEGALDVVITKLCNAAGLSGAALDVTGLPDAQVALTLTSIEAVRASLEHLTLAYDFYGLETGQTFAWRATGTGGVVATIPEADGSAGEDKANDNGAQLDRAAPLELPTLQYFTYIDAQQNYQRNTQPSSVVLPPSGKENPKNVTTPLVLSADQARRRSTQLVALAWVQREPYADVLSRKYCYLEPGDKVNFEARGLTYPVVLGSTSYGAPGLVEVQGRVNGSPRLGTVATSATQPVDSTVHTATTIPPGAVVVPGIQTPVAPGDTTPLLLNLPVLDSSDQAPRYHVAYVGENEPWEGGALYRSVDGEATYQAIDAGVLEAITGTVAIALPTVADWTVRDDTTVMRVVLEYGSLTTVNDAANAAGVQRVMVGDEMLFVGTATLVATREYDCSLLWRGRQGTELKVGTHGTNEDFVLIDAAVHRIPMTTAERNVEFDYKGVSRGQSIADVTSFPFTPTALNLLPWAVLTPPASRPVTTWQIRWYERARFVPGGRDPDFVGFRVTIYADNTFTTIKRTIDTSGGYAMDPAVLKGYDYLPSEQIVDFGSAQTNLYFTVAQVGAYGIGPSVDRTSTDLATVQGAIEPLPESDVLGQVYVTGTTQAMAVNTQYVVDNASLVTLTLPATAAMFDVMEIIGRGAGKWRVAQNAGQKIHAGRKSSTTGTGGSVTANHAHDCARLVCIVAGSSTEWDIASFS